MSVHTIHEGLDDLGKTGKDSFTRFLPPLL